MADSLYHRKPRKSNFSTDEVDTLVSSVKSHYNVLYGKYAKRATNRWVRHKAWLDILKKVNGVSVEKRTLQEVKNKWKKCQYALRDKGTRGFAIEHDDDVDSMPLQERLSKSATSTPQPDKPSQVLKSQPLSPTKLKVTRQTAKLAAAAAAVATKPTEPPPSPVNEEMCLRWNSHHSNMQTAFPSILSKEQYVDVTLAAEGKTLKCHRLILSSCSPYFEEILSGISPQQHPVLFMRDIPFWILRSLCDFMYAGEVHVFQDKLEELLSVAEALKIKGLAGKSSTQENKEEQKNENNKNENNNNSKNDTKKKPEKQEKPQPSPPPKKNTSYTNYESASSQQDYDNEDLLDPLDLLEPLYEESADEKKSSSTIVKPKENKPQYQQPIKRGWPRRLRKRKLSEQRDPSPPPVFSFRKGTRSRPNVKVPKYYHGDFSNLSKTTPNSQTDPLLDVDEIKTEPIDLEDNVIDYSDEENQYIEVTTDPNNTSSPIIITTSSGNPQKFKKIKLSKPVITEVHSVEENDPTGGLEVIKITMPQPSGESQNVRENAIIEPTTILIEGGYENPNLATDRDCNNATIIEVGTENPLAGISQVDTDNSQVDTDNSQVDINSSQVDNDNSHIDIEDSRIDNSNSQIDIEDGCLDIDSSQVDNENTRVDNDGGQVDGEEDQDGTASSQDLDNSHVDTDSENRQDEAMGTNEDYENDCQDIANINIADVRSITEEEDNNEEAKNSSLDHLEKEAMNVANALNSENQSEVE